MVETVSRSYKAVWFLSTSTAFIERIPRQCDRSEGEDGFGRGHCQANRPGDAMVYYEKVIERGMEPSSNAADGSHIAEPFRLFLEMIETRCCSSAVMSSRLSTSSSRWRACVIMRRNFKL